MPRDRREIPDATSTFAFQNEIKVENSVTVELRTRYEFTSPVFEDNGKEYREENEYDRHGNNQGLVLIFNQERFDSDVYEERTGSDRDVQNIILTFKKLGFNVKDTTLHWDLRRSQIIELFEKIKETDYQNENALVVVFMSHGDRKNVLFTRDGQINVNELIDPLCQKFKGIPKLFIIQACKGTMTRTEDTNSKKELEKELTFPIYNLSPDVVIYYSTVEGKVSVRHTKNGTWMIDELCKNLLMYGRKEDVLTLLQRTNKCVSTLEAQVEKESYKQMPVIVSTLQKKFYLTANRYRKNIHFTTDRINQVCEDMKKLLQQHSH